MQFEILGPLRCAAAPADLDLSRRREGRILAVLLLSSRRVVSMDRLIDLLWRHDPPATARQQVQNCATTLVRRFRDHHAPLPLRRTNVGYELAIEPEALDAALFEDEVANAGRLAKSGHRAAAVTQLRAALGRWHGPVLLGTDLGPFAPRAARLEELRLTATEQLFDLELGLGRHGEVVADLADAVGAHPGRERLAGQFMAALAGSGRTAEALAVYQQTRRLLRDEYAVEPGPELRALQLRILRAGGFAPAASIARPDDQHQRLLAALAVAEAARQQLELALQGAREFADGRRDGG